MKYRNKCLILHGLAKQMEIVTSSATMITKISLLLWEADKYSKPEWKDEHFNTWIRNKFQYIIQDIIINSSKNNKLLSLSKIASQVWNLS